MANIRTGSIVSDIRGSVGTETYSRNRGGLYVKARSGPADNTGANRVACREALAAVATSWSATLTYEQRESWRTYAHRHPQPGVFGDSVNTIGYARFVGHNFRAKRHGGTIPFLFAPPSPPLHPPIHVITASDTTDRVTVALPTPTYNEPWTGLRLWLYLGTEVSPGRNCYTSPWAYAGENTWDTEWLLDPWDPQAHAPITAGNKIFTRLIAQSMETGEMSTAFMASCTIEA